MPRARSKTTPSSTSEISAGNDISKDAPSRSVTAAPSQSLLFGRSLSEVVGSGLFTISFLGILVWIAVSGEGSSGNSNPWWVSVAQFFAGVLPAVYGERLVSFATSCTESDILFVSAISMIVSGLAAFTALTGLGLVAPYGKYITKSTWIYGPPISGDTAWLLQELPSFAVPALCWYLAVQGNNEKMLTFSKNAVLMSLFLFHYTNRTFIYPLRLRGGKPTPLVVFLMAFVFCLWNGYQQGRSIVAADYSASPWYDLHFIVGIVVFFIGLGMNWQADDILRNLRKPGDTKYHIPRGGMFYYVSGANFFGEILEWTGFALACWSLPAASFAFFTFCNIGPRGAQNHQWLRETFKDEYPPSRKAVIPFVW